MKEYSIAWFYAVKDLNQAGILQPEEEKVTNDNYRQLSP